MRFSQSQAPVCRRSGKSRVQVADASKLRLYENRELTQGYLFLARVWAMFGPNAKPEMRSMLWAAVGLELETTTGPGQPLFWRATVVTAGAASLQ